RGLIGADDRCILSGCRDDHPRTRIGVALDLADARIATRHVLKYWCDPAREEIRLFDGLIKSKVNAHLYPHSDRCDVAVGEEIGVDVKDFRDPVRLARRLNRSLGGLALYPRVIVAVADRRALGTAYIERLREQLTDDVARRVEVWSVRETLRLLRRAGKEAS